MEVCGVGGGGGVCEVGGGGGVCGAGVGGGGGVCGAGGGGVVCGNPVCALQDPQTVATGNVWFTTAVSSHERIRTMLLTNLQL